MPLSGSRSQRKLEIIDLDSLTIPRKVTAAIKKEAGDLVGDLKVTVTGPNRREQKMAIICLLYTSRCV